MLTRKIVRPVLRAMDSATCKYPGLFYGLSIYLAAVSSLTSTWALFPFLCMVFLIFAVQPFRALLIALIALATAAWILTHYNFPQISEKEGIRGIGLFSFEELRPYASPISKGVRYIGTLKSFENSDLKNIPISIKVSGKQLENRAKADADYWIRGTLIEKPEGNYFFRPDKNEQWHPVAASSSLAELRYQAKQTVAQAIQSQFTNPLTATFLTAISTGINEDIYLTTELSRFGLQHIVAISGFHFAIIAWLLSLLLRWALSPLQTAVAVIILLTSYFLFLGPSPSVIRSWFTATLFFAGFILKKSTLALNSLGIAIGVTILYNPFLCNHLGFQFSFLTTAGILFFFTPLDHLIQRVFPKRRFVDALGFSLIDQHGYLLLSWLRQGIALDAAVHVAAVPLLLQTLTEFPLLSFLYNLFFPFLVSISLMLLFLGFLVYPLGPLVHFLNDQWTNHALKIIYDFPSSYEIFIPLPHLEVGWATLYLTSLVVLGIFMKQKQDEKEYNYI